MTIQKNPYDKLTFDVFGHSTTSDKVDKALREHEANNLLSQEIADITRRYHYHYFFTFTFRRKRLTTKLARNKLYKSLLSSVIRGSHVAQFQLLAVGESSKATDQKPHFHGVLGVSDSATALRIFTDWKHNVGFLKYAPLGSIPSAAKYLGKATFSDDNRFTKSAMGYPFMTITTSDVPMLLERYAKIYKSLKKLIITD